MHQPDRGTCHQINISRPWGDRPFTDRERRLLHLCHLEVASLHGDRLATGDAPSATTLPPRLRQVLRCLLEGDSEKQAAARLALNAHTLHEHVKRLHRHFGVSSRGELLARCAGFLPVLAFQEGEANRCGSPNGASDGT
jgi:DNA-binding CsgD family transcriptional regulator